MSVLYIYMSKIIQLYSFYGLMFYEILGSLNCFPQFNGITRNVDFLIQNHILGNSKALFPFMLSSHCHDALLLIWYQLSYPFFVVKWSSILR